MNADNNAYNPRLTHAVWCCTRTSGSSLDGQYLQVLQVQVLAIRTKEHFAMSSRCHKKF